MKDSKMEDLVTIGLPVYNSASHLTLSLKSILAQSFKDWKLIILNDGSTDNSEELILPFLSDPRISYIKSDNRGLPFRLNQLSQLAETPYYARMDADDMMHPDRLKIQLNYLRQHPEIDVLGTAVITINEHNETFGKIVMPNEFSRSALLKRNCLMHPTIMGQTEWFKSHHYDESFRRVQDYELWLRTQSSSAFCNIAEPLLFYRTAGNVNIKNYRKSINSVIRIYAQGKALFPSKFDYVSQIIKVRLKGLIYTILGQVHLQKIFTNRRGNPLNDEEIDSYGKIIKTIESLEIGTP